MSNYGQLLPALVLFVGATPAVAAIQPSFYPESCAWVATHVLVVTEGAEIDGAVEVLESWKGDLKKGDRLTIPELAAFAPAAERTVATPIFDKQPPAHAKVTGARMVLFLVRKPAPTSKGAQASWAPAADWGGFKVSVAWVEDKSVYAFAQVFNPGPSQLIAWKLTECGLRCQVDTVLDAQATLTKAVRTGDSATLAATVPGLLQSESRYVHGAVLRELGNAGNVGVPALRNVLAEPRFLARHDDAIRSLAKAGGLAVGPDLIKQVEAATEFWQKAARDLPKGWWNGAGRNIQWDEVERLRDHYGKAHAAVEALKETKPPGAQAAVTALRDLWRSIPQLAEIDQLAKACDDALSVLK